MLNMFNLEKLTNHLECIIYTLLTPFDVCERFSNINILAYKTRVNKCNFSYFVSTLLKIPRTKGTTSLYAPSLSP